MVLTQDWFSRIGNQQKLRWLETMLISNLTRSRFKAVFRRLTGEWRPLIEKKIACDRIATEMKAASIPSVSFFVLLAVASGIATFGLLANSAPAIIGAMIIAPLMSPIMGLSYGVVQANWSQIARSGITLLFGMVLVIAIGFLAARFIEIKVTGTEMLSRAFPSLLDLGVAVAAGAAGAFSLSRDSIRNSLAGVAISVSLVPPLAVAGIGLALGHKATADVGLSFSDVGLFSGGNDLAVGSFVLFLTNLAAIVVVAGTVMTFQGYARWKRAMFGLIGAIAASITLMQPLNEEFHKLRVKSTALRLIKTLPVTHPSYENMLQIDALRVRHQDDAFVIHAEGNIEKDMLDGYPELLELFRSELEKKMGESVVIEVEAIPVDILHFRAAPDGLIDRDAPSSSKSSK